MCDFPPLRGVRRADAVIVGGGWTGLLTGYYLSQQGLRVILLTAPSGLTLPPPVATLHHSGRFGRIAAWHGEQSLRAHLAQLCGALSSLQQLPVPLREAEVYAFARSPEAVPRLHARLQALLRLGVTAAFVPDAGGCPFPVTRSVRSPALLGDASALAGALRREILQRGGAIHTARVMNANARQALTTRGRVDAPCVLLCTGKPLGLCGPRLLSLLETRTIPCFLLNAPVPLHTVQLAADAPLLLLPMDGGVMALGDAGRTGTRQAEASAAGFLRMLRREMPEWPVVRQEYRLLTRALDGLPIAGSFPTEGGRILCAAGAEDFLSSVLAAQTLTRLALQQPLSADLALRPDRQLPQAQLHRMSLQLRRARSAASLRASAPRCSHCRCRLRWHRAARWWGCPCCGSAYGALGQRLGGPALFDARTTPGQRPAW